MLRVRDQSETRGVRERDRDSEVCALLHVVVFARSHQME